MRRSTQFFVRSEVIVVACGAAVGAAEETDGVVAELLGVSVMGLANRVAGIACHVDVPRG